MSQTLELDPVFSREWEGKDPFTELEKTEGEIFRQVKSRRTFRVSGWATAGVLLLILFLIFFVLSLMFRAVFHLLFSLRGIVFWAAVLLVIGFLARRRR